MTESIFFYTDNTIKNRVSGRVLVELASGQIQVYGRIRIQFLEIFWIRVEHRDLGKMSVNKQKRNAIQKTCF